MKFSDLQTLAETTSETSGMIVISRIHQSSVFGSWSVWNTLKTLGHWAYFDNIRFFK